MDWISKFCITTCILFILPRIHALQCPTDWLKGNYGCYLRECGSMTSASLRHYCKNIDSRAVLPTIWKKEVQTEVTRMMGSATNVWINGFDDVTEGQMYVIENDITCDMPAIEWQTFQPFNNENSDCAELRKTSCESNQTLISFAECSAEKRILCHIPSIPPCLNACPTDWLEGKYGCYLLQSGNMQSAPLRDHCKTMDQRAVLPTIWKQDVQYEVTSLMGSAPSVWINAFDDVAEGKFYTIDGAGKICDMPPIEWETSQPFNDENSDCAELKKASSGASQTDISFAHCSAEKQIMCHIPSMSPCSTVNGKLCNSKTDCRNKTHSTCNHITLYFYTSLKYCKDPCIDSSDCAGRTKCQSGFCSCKNFYSSCIEDQECCSGTCLSNIKKCGAKDKLCRTDMECDSMVMPNGDKKSGGYCSYNVCKKKYAWG